MAMPNRTTAEAAVAIAPAVIRRAATSSSAGPNPRTFSHISSAAAADTKAPSQARTRTLTQPGDSTSRLKNSRITIRT